MSKLILHALCAVVCILVLVIISGCTSYQHDSSMNRTTISSSDPETGIQEWVAAVNNKDLGRLYDLSPDEIKTQMSWENFTAANENNEFLRPDETFTFDSVMNKTGNATVANLKVILLLHKNTSANSTQSETIPLYFNFIELFEHGEWKVWSIPWS